MGKFIGNEKLSDTVTLVTYSDGLYLWDGTQEMNIAMYCKNEREAFLKALTFYQKRLQQVEKEHKALKTKVDSFLDQFVDEEET